MNEQQELLELAAEVRGALRVVEGQRGQRVDHPEAAGVAPVDGFHADDRDHDLLGHAESVDRKSVV